MNIIIYQNEIEKGQYTIVFKAFYEDYEADPLLTEEENNRIIEQLNRGEYQCFTAKVEILVNGIEMGNNFLWQCLGNPKEFFEEKDGYFSDMVRESLNHIRHTLRELKKVNL